MVYQDGVRPPKGKPPTASRIETDLSRIQQLSREHDDEDWEFRSWLKQNAPDNLDGIVKALSQKYFTLIDCTQCANCCRSLQAEFKKSELLSIAKTIGQSIEAFEKQFMSEGKVTPPARCWTATFVRATKTDPRLAGRILTCNNRTLHLG